MAFYLGLACLPAGIYLPLVISCARGTPILVGIGVARLQSLPPKEKKRSERERERRSADVKVRDLDLQMRR